MKAASSLRKQFPGKYVFAFLVAAPDKNGFSAEFEGILRVKTQEEMTSLTSKILDLLEGVGRIQELPVGEVPPGSVRIEK